MKQAVQPLRYPFLCPALLDTGGVVRGKMPPRTETVRRTIDTLCELREAQAAAARCTARADRSRDLAAAYRRRDALDRTCRGLEARLEVLRRPATDPRLRRAVERDFDAGRLATRSRSRTEVRGVAILAPGWRLAASRITNLRTMARVLAYLETFPSWCQRQLQASPHPAVPWFVSTHESLAPLQNLPAWQSARITLVACAIWNKSRTVKELQRWIRSLGIHRTYLPLLLQLLEA